MRIRQRENRMPPASTLQEGPISDRTFPTFSTLLRTVRHRLSGKQAWLSAEIGCSAAAISLWESGARLPTPSSLARIVAALAKSGVPTPDLLDLHRSWRSEMLQRCAPAVATAYGTEGEP
jgi:hypothetical protein